MKTHGLNDVECSHDRHERPVKLRFLLRKERFPFTKLFLPATVVSYPHNEVKLKERVCIRVGSDTQDLKAFKLLRVFVHDRQVMESTAILAKLLFSNNYADVATL